MVSCLAHTRPKFHDAEDHHPELAEYVLGHIQQLYALERVCLDESLGEERHKQEARPCL